MDKGAILAVDYGLKRVGLAVCDPDRKVAVGAGMIENLSGRKLARAVYKEAVDRNAKVVLVGLPPEGATDVEPVIEGADRLSNNLQKMGMEIWRWDESFTTFEALKSRRMIGGKSKRKKKWVDEAAAVIILRTFLDSR